jgi:phosphatidate phosphatase APP1
MLFYVSSSEWNLYRFLVLFTEIHKLPKAVLLLKDIKTSLNFYGLEEEAIIISLKNKTYFRILSQFKVCTDWR